MSDPISTKTNILAGIASVIGLFGVFYPDSASLTSVDDDAEALRRDWCAVGLDIEDAALAAACEEYIQDGEKSYTLDEVRRGLDLA